MGEVMEPARPGADQVGGAQALTTALDELPMLPVWCYKGALAANP